MFTHCVVMIYLSYMYFCNLEYLFSSYFLSSFRVRRYSGRYLMMLLLHLPLVPYLLSSFLVAQSWSRLFCYLMVRPTSVLVKYQLCRCALHKIYVRFVLRLFYKIFSMRICWLSCQVVKSTYRGEACTQCCL